jgi:hypothetical protein
MLSLMGEVLKLIWWAVIGLFRSRASLEAEIVALRHQLNVLRRKSPKRLAFSKFDRLIFAGLYRIAPGVVHTLGRLSSVGIVLVFACSGDGSRDIAAVDRRWRSKFAN